MHTHQTNLLILFPWEIYSNVIHCRVSNCATLNAVLQLDCCFVPSNSFSFRTRCLARTWSAVCMHVCVCSVRVDSCRAVSCSVSEFLVRICYFAKLKTSAKNLWTKVFLEKRMCLCKHRELIKVLWYRLNYVDRQSSLLFVVFSISRSLPTLAPNRLFFAVCSSFHLVFFFSVRRTEATQTHVYIYKLCTLRHTELLLVWFWLDVHYVTEKNDRGYDSCSCRARTCGARETDWVRARASIEAGVVVKREKDRYDCDWEEKKQ